MMTESDMLLIKNSTNINRVECRSIYDSQYYIRSICTNINRVECRLKNSFAEVGEGITVLI